MNVSELDNTKLEIGYYWVKAKIQYVDPALTIYPSWYVAWRGSCEWFLPGKDQPLPESMIGVIGPKITPPDQ